MLTSPDIIDIVPASQLSDVEALRPVLEDGVRDNETGEVIRSEVDEILQSVSESQAGMSDRYYAVAMRGGEVLGIMGLAKPGARMLEYATTPNPAELVNAFVSKHVRGMGVGVQLFDHMQDVATIAGNTELFVNSGPRYEHTGWRFWQSVMGEPYTKATDYYGTGHDAPVWHEILDK